MRYICSSVLLLFGLLLTRTIDAEDEPGCETPETFAFGSVLLNGDENLDPEAGSQWVDTYSTLKFSCSKAYRMSGQSTLSCNEDGTWDFDFPVCNKRLCNPPPKISNGKSFGLRRAPGSTVRYECSPGYTFRNPEATKIECQSLSATDLEWSGELPACVDADRLCDHPPEIPNGKRVGLRGVPGRSTVRYECSPGYTFRNPEATTLECQTLSATDFPWSGEFPACIVSERLCDPPPRIANGKRFGLRRVPGSTVRYECIPGYTFRNPEATTIECQQLSATDFEWSGELPACVDSATCPSLPAIPHGYITVSPVERKGVYFPGDEVELYCDSGFEMDLSKGTNVASCTHDGTWDNDIATCIDPEEMPVEEITCSRPQLSEFSYLVGEDQDSYPEDSEIQILCLPGFELVGVTRNKCTDYGWEYSFPECKVSEKRQKIPRIGLPVPEKGSRTIENKLPEITCSRPQLSEHSYLEGGEARDYYPEDSVVRILCPPGYELVGITHNKCTDSGWEYGFPECKGLSTPEPTQVPTRPWTPEPTQALTSPSTPQPTQALTECPGPESFPHGAMEEGDDNKRIDVTEGLTFPRGSSIRFSCQDGLVLYGPKVVICVDNGNWETNFPTCYRRTCSSPEDVLHGKWLGLRRTPGNYVTLKCDHSYKLRNPKVQKLECRRASPPNVEWFGERPACVEKAVCPDPGSPRNGTGFRISDATHGTFYEGSKVTVICEDDYELIGSESIICETNGRWSGPRGKCKPAVICSDLPEEPNGYYSVQDVGRSDYYFPKDEVELVCNPGYKEFTGDKGALLVLCYDDGTWDETIATCRQTTCPRPKLEKNSFLENGEKLLDLYPYDQHLKIRCPPGYQLLGTDWNRCTDHGWDFTFPECHEITCPDPGIPEDGSRAGPSGKFVINSTVYFECYGGYIMSGSKQRTCQSNGQWDGSLTTCSQNNNEGCKNPGIPISGHRIGTNYKTGAMVTFKCDPQFTLIGSIERVCQPDGHWNGTETFCRGSLYFDRPEDVKTQLLFDLDKKMAKRDSELPSPRGRMKQDRSILSNLNIKNTGGHLVFYFVFDSSKSVGTENFNTSIKFAKALVKRVGVSSTVHIGAVTYGRIVEQNIFPLGTTTEKAVLKELSKIKEIGGGTSTKPALSLVRDMVATVQKANPKWEPIKSTVYIITDGIHNIGGNPEDVATILKKSGVEIFVIGLVGHDKKANAGSFLALATSPKHVLSANGFDTVEYLVDFLLNNNTLNYTRCGISVRDPKKESRIIGGKVSTLHWPWMTHLSIKKKDGNEICGGSIIENTWVLTAAHCIKEGVKADDITVTIGTLNVAEDGDENREKHYVERIYKHPQFNERTKLDYDVALLKLKRPITFGKYIRRICLPPELTEIGRASSLYREGEPATVTGFGRYDPSSMATSNQLKEVEIFLQSNKTCVDSLAKLYPKNYKEIVTDSMMCAGDDEGGKDACEGDSGGPLMQELRDEGGVEPYWVQVGVVSWGVPGKCGAKDYYGYYANVAKAVPWVYDVMAGKRE